MFFRMPPFVLLSMVTFQTFYWLVEILPQPIRFFKISAYTMWKNLKNSIRHWCQKWRCILFGATYRENKQWIVILQISWRSIAKHRERNGAHRQIALKTEQNLGVQMFVAFCMAYFIVCKVVNLMKTVYKNVGLMNISDIKGHRRQLLMASKAKEFLSEKLW